jgi:cysteine desulfuration protein SufE
MSTMQERQEEIVETFEGLEDWEDRYRLVIDLGRQLEPMSDEFKTDQYRVKGCQSQVWIHSRCEDGHVFFEADSDAAITKGIIALLLRIASGAAAEEIMYWNPDFLEEIGLQQHLSMSRANGLYSMFKQIKLDALVYAKQNV